MRSTVRSANSTKYKFDTISRPSYYDRRGCAVRVNVGCKIIRSSFENRGETFLTIADFDYHFSRKCARLLQWVVFFLFLDAYSPLFCSLFICLLRKFKTLETSEPGQNKNKRPETRKHTKDPSQFPTPVFFRHYATFFEIFWIAPKGPHFICFDISQQDGCQKIPKGPPFYIFRHCDTVQKSN